MAITGHPSPGAEHRYQIYVLDERLSMLDLYIAGATLARGYLHDPARTAAQFLPDPVERRQKMTLSEAPESIYQVVMNHEEQYSIWPAHRALPAGWQAAGPAAAKQECLDYIAEVWTDMRPLSLRRQLADAGAADLPE